VITNNNNNNTRTSPPPFQVITVQFAPNPCDIGLPTYSRPFAVALTVARSHVSPLNCIHLDAQDNTWMERLFNCSYIDFPFRCFAGRVIHFSHFLVLLGSTISLLLLLIAFHSAWHCAADRGPSTVTVVSFWPVNSLAVLCVILHKDGICAPACPCSSDW
jgi:hypothetical protein